MSAEDAVADLLTLKSLRTLAAVARAGSLTRAASELGLAQSAVSRQLGELERALGGPLFHRTGRGMQPSDLGEQVLPSVQSLLAQAGELARAGRERAGTPSGVVTLGMVPGVAGFLAPALYGEVNRACPQVRLRVLEGYSGDMETALTQGRIEMAVLHCYRARGANSYRRLFEAQVCLVGRREMLARALRGVEGKRARGALPASAPLQALAGVPLVLPVPPNAIRNLLDEQLSRRRVALQVVLEGGSSVIVKGMMRMHDCASVLPRHAVADELASGVFAAVPLAERAFRQSVVLATSSQRPFTLAGRAVAGLIPSVVDRFRDTMPECALLPNSRT